MKNPFRKPKPTASQVAATHLEETELQLLEAYKDLEHYTAQVEMLELRRDRLKTRNPITGDAE